MADQVLVDAVPRIDLANLIEELKTKNRESLVEAIEVYQERLLDELCGKKRKPNGTYRRAGSGRRLKTIVTTLGVVRFRTLKMKNHATGETLTPILDILDVRGRKYTRQVKAQCAELTSTPFQATSTSISRVQLDSVDLDVLHKQCNELRKWNSDPLVKISPDLDRAGLETHYREHLKPHKYMRTCNAMTQVGQVLADGSVTVSTRCLSTIRFGNITQQPFTEIWRGGEFEHFRTYMRRVELMPACMRCCGAL